MNDTNDVLKLWLTTCSVMFVNYLDIIQQLFGFILILASLFYTLLKIDKELKSRKANQNNTPKKEEE